MVPANSKILELGCATGFMSEYFRDYLNCRVYGVDIDPAAVKLASKYTVKSLSCDLDQNDSWTKIKKIGKFDVVFASAVLEHLKDPWSAVKHIHSVLKPGGVIIATIPNIAHWRMRLSLMQGNWDYQQYGILDNTHLKFFTYFTFQNLLKDAGFKIEKIAIDPAGGIKYFDPIAKHFPNFYAHQIAIKAVKH